MDKLLIYGGTFNPIHYGHLHLVKNFAEVIGAQQVILMPAKTPPHKAVKHLVSAQHRLEMCRLAVQGTGWQVSDLEICRSTPSYTADTLAQLSALYPHTKLYFLTGEDMFLTLLSWYEPERILHYATICAAPRSTDGLARMVACAWRIRLAGGHTLVWNIPYLPISSTQVRAAVRDGQSISQMVPPAVESYIRQNSLYEESD